MSESPLFLDLQNEHLSFRLHADASGQIRDMKTGAVWRMDRVAIQETGPIVRNDRAIFHRVPRADDEQHKLELLELYKIEGMVLGSEEGRDFGVTLVDWFENRHAHVPGESIPLWPLVYHDGTTVI